MVSALRGLTVLSCAAALCAQTQTARTPSAQPASQQTTQSGLETEWEIATVLQQIGAHASQLLPALERIDARSWVDKGASETYAEQLQASKDQARALADGAKSLARSPEHLSASLELFFRIQGLETMLTSVEEGVRKYQSPADAESLVRLEAQNGANRDRFQRYIVNLASEREHELQVMDKEAQRCRGMVTAPATKSGKKN
jgi:hypothetical protein